MKRVAWRGECKCQGTEDGRLSTGVRLSEQRSSIQSKKRARSGPGQTKSEERRWAVGFQASRSVLFRFEVEMARAKTAQQCPDNGRVFVEAGK